MEKFIGELLSAEGETAEPHSVKSLVAHFGYVVTVRARERMPFVQTRCKRTLNRGNPNRGAQECRLFLGGF